MRWQSQGGTTNTNASLQPQVSEGHIYPEHTTLNTVQNTNANASSQDENRG
ncbi:hypothetical protein F5887DRAFT_1076158 [Amanita rubescens]|nr:hypothetical protein F5887DRAFT_1076158 [Amanita rubescens]